MGHTDDAYAAMLLTMALSPNQEEYVRPLGVQEFRRFEAIVRGSRFHAIGGLLDLDISGLMMYLGLSEEESYRAFTLMHRGVQMSYALEGLAAQGIDVVTQYDADYPRRLEDKLKDAAPPFLYRCQSADALDGPAIAIVGISGVRTTPEAQANVETLVKGAARLGYGIITGGEPGVARLAVTLAEKYGCRIVEILGGGMRERLADGAIRGLLEAGRAAVLSTEHPDALLTVSHAIARNKLLFAMADAAFIFNTDGRRGETDALVNRTCDWVYAWEEHAGNRALIARGARPFRRLTDGDLDDMSRHWSSSRAQQINMFDLL